MIRLVKKSKTNFLFVAPHNLTLKAERLAHLRKRFSENSSIKPENSKILSSRWLYRIASAESGKVGEAESGAEFETGWSLQEY